MLKLLKESPTSLYVFST